MFHLCKLHQKAAANLIWGILHRGPLLEVTALAANNVRGFHKVFQDVAVILPVPSEGMCKKSWLSQIAKKQGIHFEPRQTSLEAQAVSSNFGYQRPDSAAQWSNMMDGEVTKTKCSLTSDVDDNGKALGVSEVLLQTLLGVPAAFNFRLSEAAGFLQLDQLAFKLRLQGRLWTLMCR